MGVKHFFIWLSKNCSNSIKPLTQKPIIDNLALDLNGIIHPCAQKIFNYNQEKKRFISKAFYPPTSKHNYTKLYSLICERIAEYIFYLQPRKRLILCIDGIAGFAKMNQQRSRRFVSVKKRDYNCPFDPNCITPGTYFLHKLSQYIDWYLRLMISTCPQYQNLEIIFSNEKVPGEGEHKILHYIRKYAILGESYCIHGLDADLIMLAMATKVEKMYISREEYKSKNIVILDINNIRKELIVSLDWSTKEKQAKKKYLVNDFILMCFLVGNDFLPTIPTLAILEGGIDVMINTYKTVGEDCGHLTSSRYLHFDAIFEFFDRLSKHSPELLKEKYTKRECFFQDKYLEQSVIEGEENEDKNDKSIDIAKYKKLYYTNKLKDVSVEKICHKYIQGLDWVFKYYVKGIPDWNWYYKWPYAPFLSDLVTFSKTYKKKSFSLNKPLTPFQQLLCVLPPSSRNIIPKPLNNLLTKDSPISKYYPETFEIDLSGKRRDWEGIILLPNINFKKIQKEYEKMIESVDRRDQKRNQSGHSFIYTYNHHVNYVFKSGRGNINDCHCKLERIDL